MLRKDLELFRLAIEVELDGEELWDAADSMLWVYDVIGIRYRDLVGEPRRPHPPIHLESE